MPAVCHLAQAGQGHHLLMVIWGYLKVISALPLPQVLSFVLFGSFKLEHFLES